MRLLAIMAMMLFSGSIQAQDDLQKFIDNLSDRPMTRAESDDYQDVDLSKFTATERHVTLYIRGQKIRFINGSLTRASDLEGPVLEISNNGDVEVAAGATIGDWAYTNNRKYPTISLNSGSLYVKGTVKDSWEYLYPSVVMLSDNDKFVLETSGVLYSGISSEAKGHIEIKKGGTLYASSISTHGNIWITGDFGSSVFINLLERESYIYLDEHLTSSSLIITAMEKTVGDFIVRTAFVPNQSDVDAIKFTGNKEYALKISNMAGSPYSSGIYLAENDDLQDYINSLSANTLTTIDLSQFKSTNRRKSLIVSGKRRVTFVNGTIARDTCSVGPALIIEGNSDVTVAKGATITGKDLLNYDEECEVVRVNGGSLIINGGEVVGAYGVRKDTPKEEQQIVIGYVGWGMLDPAIRIVGPDDSFHFYSGTVYGDIYCDSQNAGLYLNGGELKTASLWERENDLVDLYSPFVGQNKMPPIGWVDAKIVSQSDVTISGTIPYAHVWGYNLYGDEGEQTTVGDGFAIKLLGNATVLTPKKLYTNLRIKAPNKTYNDVLVQPAPVMDGYPYKFTKDDKELVRLISFGEDGDYDSDDYGGFGSSNNTNMVMLTGNKIIIYYDDIQEWIDNLKDDTEGDKGKTEDNPATLKVPCEGIPMNGDLEFDDISYFLLTGEMPDEDCQGTIKQNDGDVVVKAGTTVTLTHLYWQGCGCSKHIYVYGTVIIDVDIHITNVIRFVHIRPGGRLVFRGGDGTVTNEVIYVEGGIVEYHYGNYTGGKYGWYNYGGTVYIYGGTIGGGTCGGWTRSGATTYIHGGTINGGIVNYGTTYIYGGTIIGGYYYEGIRYTIVNYPGGTLRIYGGKCSGPGTIWNGGTIYLDGGTTVNINDVYMGRDCRIYITSRLTYILRLHISVKNIILGQPIVLGGEGYILTADDCKNIVIDLPGGYEWKYDDTRRAIIITSKGDANNDNNIDVADISAIISYMAGNRNGVELKQVDANGDGVVDVADIATVISMMAEK